MLMELEVQDENAHGDEKRQHQASQDDENVLRYTRPWRMTCSEEGRMVLHDIGAWKAVSILKKRSRVHRERSVLNFPRGRVIVKDNADD